MKLVSFSVTNYRSITKAHKISLGQYTVLLGKNNEGKSNISNGDEQEAIISTICRHENRDHNRIYRSYMFRNGKENGKQKHRTEYNGQLASIRFPILYQRFRNDKTISFAFTEDIEDENLRKRY